MSSTPDQPAATGSAPGREQDPLALERQVCFALVVAARSVLSVYRPVLEPMGLTHPQYLVMLALWGREPLSVRELSETLALDAPTLSPLLKRLEAAGLLQRNRLPEDQRSLAVSLTEQGRALRARAEQVPAQVVQRLGVDVAELEALRDGLSRIIAAAGAPGREG
ncbi:MarR family winged helix-turn-helix transcriptional regulator [Kineococcus auxinigenes]|uniref:MarR family winged helix-turn-helix transcriptional regulator n=1 Tax=unclassified Kineococcus TaxID=2621656 RepID=UPI003D7EE6F2